MMIEMTKLLLPLINRVGILNKPQLAIHLVMSLCHDLFLQSHREYLHRIQYYVCWHLPIFSWCCWWWLPTKQETLGALKPVWRLPAIYLILLKIVMVVLILHYSDIIYLIKVKSEINNKHVY